MTSRAMRYAREGTPEARHELLLKAYDVDPDCPEALEALSCASLGEPGTLNFVLFFFFIAVSAGFSACGAHS